MYIGHNYIFVRLYVFSYFHFRYTRRSVLCMCLSRSFRLFGCEKCKVKGHSVKNYCTSSSSSFTSTSWILLLYICLLFLLYCIRNIIIFYYYYYFDVFGVCKCYNFNLFCTYCVIACACANHIHFCTITATTKITAVSLIQNRHSRFNARKTNKIQREKVFVRSIEGE